MVLIIMSYLSGYYVSFEEYYSPRDPGDYLQKKA
jgi:hypothetical protein